MTVSLQTVVELPSFVKAAAKLLSEEEIADLIIFLATNPQAGDIIKGAKGLRKLRWQRQGMGKRGGARVIYFFYNPYIPVFLFTVYAKADKVDLNMKEKQALVDYADHILKQHGK
jgi:hypothetical protein